MTLTRKVFPSLDLSFFSGVVIRSDSLLLDTLAAGFLFIALGKLKQLPDMSELSDLSMSLSFLSPFLLPVETLWYSGGDKEGEKRKGEMGKVTEIEKKQGDRSS